MEVKKKIKSSVPQLKRFLSKSLELWDTTGYDTEYGGYIEALDFQGNPLYNLNKRFRIHPRTIFAHSASTIWGYYDGLKTAEQAFLHVIHNIWLEDGGFATLSSREGKILDKSIFTYDHAFVMLGFGWLYKASNNPLHKTWLYETWDMLNSRLIHSDKGFLTSIPEPTSPPRRLQNPHMHMLEAMLNLVELFDDEIWIDASKRIYNLFEKHFALPYEGKIREFFNDDWSPDITKGHLLEPGHHYEWIWILQKYESLIGDNVPIISDLYKFALLGSNKMGLGYNETNFEGLPTRINHRMWIQTEVIKAHIAMYKRTSDEHLLEKILEAKNLLFDKYLITKYATWYDELDDEGNNISNNSPTSTLYHLVIAFHEYITLANSL